MPLFEIKFTRRISGYGGPGSSWAKEFLVFEATTKREANKFFQTLIVAPDHTRELYGWGILNREFGTWYRSVQVQSVDESKFSMWTTFKPRVYTQAELTQLKLESDARTEAFFQQRVEENKKREEARIASLKEGDVVYHKAEDCLNGKRIGRLTADADGKLMCVFLNNEGFLYLDLLLKDLKLNNLTLHKV